MLVFATSAVLGITDVHILAQNENTPPNLQKVMGHTVNSVTFMDRACKQILAERKERLKPVLNEAIRTLCAKKTSESKYLFEQNLPESMTEAKESFRISNNFLLVSCKSGSKCSFGYTNISAGARFSISYSLNFRSHKRNQQKEYVTSKKLQTY